jgi:hypothetical protein
MEKVAMTSTSDASGFYRPTADAPRFAATTGCGAGASRSHSASAPSSQAQRQSAQSAAATPNR